MHCCCCWCGCCYFYNNAIVMPMLFDVLYQCYCKNTKIIFLHYWNNSICVTAVAVVVICYLMCQCVTAVVDVAAVIFITTLLLYYTSFTNVLLHQCYYINIVMCYNYNLICCCCCCCGCLHCYLLFIVPMIIIVCYSTQ